MKAPRRCGRIAGYRAFNLPQGTRARLFALRSAPHRWLVEPAFVAQAHHFVDEYLLLLVVEARKERLGGIGDIALILRAVD